MRFERPSRLTGLVDCNNFFVSCELLFRPDLLNRPVAVLSHGDGCIIARSNEIKRLGIKMGTPIFQVRDLIKQHNIHLFSSNFSLYGDISARVMSILDEFTFEQEIYSVDESFLNLEGIASCTRNPTEYGQLIKRTVLRSVGIPVCVGIAPTKVLAKLANFAAKKWPQTGGVLDLSDPMRRERLMRIVPASEIWGVGSRTSDRLKQLGIITAWDLACQPSDKIRDLFNVSIARIVMELNGIPCLGLIESQADRQQIMCSRSFSRRLTEYQELSEALANFCSRAAEKLRRQHSSVGHITIFLRTNPLETKTPQYQRTADITLSSATQDTRVIIRSANRLLHDIFKQGYQYYKCGVVLSKIRPVSSLGQTDLFESCAESSPGSAKSEALMQTIDRINARFPKSLTIAATGFDQSWRSPIKFLSPSYTTNWNELPRVICS